MNIKECLPNNTNIRKCCASEDYANHGVVFFYHQVHGKLTRFVLWPDGEVTDEAVFDVIKEIYK